MAKKKRAQLQNDVTSLKKTADQKAEDAERHGKLSFISESNALRKRAKERIEEIKELGKQLAEQKN